MPGTLVLPPEYAELSKQIKDLYLQAEALVHKKKALYDEATKLAGWTKCCRCFPASVGPEGYCGCCDMDHATGTRTPYDPFKEEPTSPLAEAPWTEGDLDGVYSFDGEIPSTD